MTTTTPAAETLAATITLQVTVYRGDDRLQDNGPGGFDYGDGLYLRVEHADVLRTTPHLPVSALDAVDPQAFTEDPDPDSRLTQAVVQAMRTIGLRHG